MIQPNQRKAAKTPPHYINHLAREPFGSLARARRTRQNRNNQNIVTKHTETELSKRARLALTLLGLILEWIPEGFLTHRYIEKLDENRHIILYFITGILLTYFLNTLTSFFPIVMLFFLIVLALFFVIMLFLFEDLTDVRVILLGASITSLTFAFVNFSSIISLGNVQIPLDQIAGTFRSVLLTSYFSLLERLTKLFEDQRHKRRDIAKV